MARNFVRLVVAVGCLWSGCGGDDDSGGSTGINTNNAVATVDGGAPLCPVGQHQVCVTVQHRAPPLVCKCVSD
jgi:hypothetical protein